MVRSFPLARLWCLVLQMFPDSTVKHLSPRYEPTKPGSTFPEFLAASWSAGVVRYDVDFIARTCTYYGADGDEYVESYPAVDVG
jgi:uncharacterized protein YbcV (DUF1398 family)